MLRGAGQAGKRLHQVVDLLGFLRVPFAMYLPVSVGCNGLISVGIVLSVLGITPQNFLERLNTITTNIYNLGFDAFESILGYLLLGAMVVIPIWLVMRLASARKSRPPEV